MRIFPSVLHQWSLLDKVEAPTGRDGWLTRKVEAGEGVLALVSSWRNTSLVYERIFLWSLKGYLFGLILEEKIFSLWKNFYWFWKGISMISS